MDTPTHPLHQRRQRMIPGGGIASTLSQEESVEQVQRTRNKFNLWEKNGKESTIMDSLSFVIKKYETGTWIVLFLQCQSPWLPAASAAHFSCKSLLGKDYVPKTEPREKNQVPGSVSNGALYSCETATISQVLPLNSHLLPKDDSYRHIWLCLQ